MTLNQSDFSSHDRYHIYLFGIVFCGDEVNNGLNEPGGGWGIRDVGCVELCGRVGYFLLQHIIQLLAHFLKRKDSEDTLVDERCLPRYEGLWTRDTEELVVVQAISHNRYTCL